MSGLDREDYELGISQMTEYDATRIRIADRDHDGRLSKREFVFFSKGVDYHPELLTLDVKHRAAHLELEVRRVPPPPHLDQSRPCGQSCGGADESVITRAPPVGGLFSKQTPPHASLAWWLAFSIRPASGTVGAGQAPHQGFRSRWRWLRGRG